MRYISFLLVVLFFLSSCEEYERINPHDENSDYYTQLTQTATVDGYNITLTANIDSEVEASLIEEMGFYYLHPSFASVEEIEQLLNDDGENNAHYVEYYAFKSIVTDRNNFRTTLLLIEPETYLYYQPYIKYTNSSGNEHVTYLGKLEKVLIPNKTVVKNISTTSLKSTVTINEVTSVVFDPNNFVVAKNTLYYAKPLRTLDNDGKITSSVLNLMKYNSASNEWELELETTTSNGYYYSSIVSAQDYIMIIFSKEGSGYYLDGYYNIYDITTKELSGYRKVPEGLYLAPTDLTDLNYEFFGWKSNCFAIDNTIYYISNPFWKYTIGPNWQVTDLNNTEYVSVNDDLILNSNNKSYFLNFNNFSSNIVVWDGINEQNKFEINANVINSFVLNNDIYVLAEYVITRFRNGSPKLYEIDMTQTGSWNDNNNIAYAQYGYFKYNTTTNTLANKPSLLCPFDYYNNSPLLFQSNVEYIGSLDSSIVTSRWNPNKEEYIINQVFPNL